MRKKGTGNHNSPRSMKTFFIYIALVSVLILISFSIKAFLVFQKSLFDGSNHFTVAVVQEGRVAEVVSFNPRLPSLSLAEIKGDKLPVSEMGKILAVAPDALIQAKESLPVGDNVTGMMTKVLWQFHSLDTDMTIIDALRLTMLSRSIQEDNKIVKVIKLPRQESDIDKIMTSFFSDEMIASENVPIQIVNGSDTPGMGRRLERVLNNLGGNVIGVSTAPSPVQKSKIEYIGEEETYTVKKLKRVLNMPTSPLKGQNTADIVITIGTESKETSRF